MPGRRKKRKNVEAAEEEEEQEEQEDCSANPKCLKPTGKEVRAKWARHIQPLTSSIQSNRMPLYGPWLLSFDCEKVRIKQRA